MGNVCQESMLLHIQFVKKLFSKFDKVWIHYKYFSDSLQVLIPPLLGCWRFSFKIFHFCFQFVLHEGVFGRLQVNRDRIEIAKRNVTNGAEMILWHRKKTIISTLRMVDDNLLLKVKILRPLNWINPEK